MELLKALSGKLRKAVVFNPGHSLIIKNNVTVNGALTLKIMPV
jgi:hypothetical protein